MLFQSRTWLPATVVVGATLALVAANGTPARAQARQVPAESLIYDLKNPDPNRRQAAAHELGINKYAAATPDLVALASDPSPSVRREAELSLEQMDDVRALPGFVRFAADDEKDIRDRAVQALVTMYLPRAAATTAMLTKLQNILSHKLDDDSDLVVEPDIPVDPSAVQVLRDRVTDREVKIRRNAARALGIFRADAGIPELVAALREDRDDEVRFEAARSLRKIGNATVGDSITPMLYLNNDVVRHEIMATLASLRHRKAVSDLTRIFEQAKPSDKSRSLALSALADIGDPSSRSLFLSLKADKDETIRLFANEGLARVSDAGLKTAVSGQRLTEKSVRVQAAEAFGLLRMGQVEYLDELVRGLGKSATRELAREYLQETPQAHRKALFATRSTDAAVRLELAEVFGLMGDRSAMPALLDLSKDTDAGVAKAAERAIRWINAPGRNE